MILECNELGRNFYERLGFKHTLKTRLEIVCDHRELTEIELALDR